MKQDKRQPIWIVFAIVGEATIKFEIDPIIVSQNPASSIQYDVGW